MSKSEEKQTAEIAQLSYEQALAELEKIVAELEAGDVPLQKSIEAYERGEALRQHCSALIKQAEARIEKLRVSAEGKIIGKEPLDQQN